MDRPTPSSVQAALPRSPRSPWLNATVLGIGLASLLSDVGHEMATVAMPALLTTLGGSAVLLGFIEGTADAIASFTKLISGAYSDRLVRRKPLAVVGYVLTAAGMASFAFATHSWDVAVGRIVGWLGRGVRSPLRKVLLTEATTAETRGRSFGFERAMDSTGAVVGPLVAMALLSWIGMRGLFLATLVPGLLAAASIALVVREKPHTPKKHARLASSFREMPRDFKRFLVAVLFAGLGDFSNTLLILWATQAWTPRYGIERAALIAMGFYVGYNVVCTGSCYLSGVLADRLPKQRLLAAGYAMAVIPAAALLIPGASFLKFAIVFGGSGLYTGIWETVESTTAAEYLPASVRGTGFGVLESVNGIADFLSSVVVSALWVASPSVSMGYVMLTALVGAAIVARVRPATSAVA